MTALDDAYMPTIGRLVLYRAKDGLVRPGVVTCVHGKWCVDICVFPCSVTDLESGPKAKVTHADPHLEPACMPSWDWMPYQKSIHAAQKEN